MGTFAHFGPDWVDRPWWDALGWLMPLLTVLIVAGVALWVVTRLTDQRRAIAVGPTPSIPAGPAPSVRPPSDAALERARMRYASGEMTRDEFVRLSRDLGAPIETEEVDDA